MTSSIKIRSAIRDGTATVRMLIHHVMAVGGRTASGDYIEPHFITEITCFHNKREVIKGHWGAGIARNPYLSFVIENAQVGDRLLVRWRDNKDDCDEIEARL